MIMTASQAAKQLNVTRDAVVMSIHRGKLIATKLGSFWVIDSEEVKRWDGIRQKKGRKLTKTTN